MYKASNPYNLGMDELTIDDKKYISSKRAAKLTGYAKDYIGQLCREGRVPARLVGRTWYVLESAVEDHRFGQKKSEPEVPKGKVSPENTSVTSTWESPHYEATPTEVLPSINRMHLDLESAEPSKTVEDASHIPASDPSLISEGGVKDLEPVASQNDTEIALKTDEGVQPIPFQIVYDLPPEDLLPKARKEAPIPSASEAPTIKDKLARIFISALILLTAVFAALAIISTGFTDRYVYKYQYKPASFVTGIGIYNK